MENLKNEDKENKNERKLSPQESGQLSPAIAAASSETVPPDNALMNDLNSRGFSSLTSGSSKTKSRIVREMVREVRGKYHVYVDRLHDQQKGLVHISNALDKAQTKLAMYEDFIRGCNQVLPLVLKIPKGEEERTQILKNSIRKAMTDVTKDMEKTRAEIIRLKNPQASGFSKSSSSTTPSNNTTTSEFSFNSQGVAAKPGKNITQIQSKDDVDSDLLRAMSLSVRESKIKNSGLSSSGSSSVNSKFGSFTPISSNKTIIPGVSLDLEKQKKLKKSKTLLDDLETAWDRARAKQSIVARVESKLTICLQAQQQLPHLLASVQTIKEEGAQVLRSRILDKMDLFSKRMENLQLHHFEIVAQYMTKKSSSPMSHSNSSSASTVGFFSTSSTSSDSGSTLLSSNSSSSTSTLGITSQELLNRDTDSLKTGMSKPAG